MSSKSTIRVGMKRKHSAVFAATQPYVSQKSQKITHDIPPLQRPDMDELSTIECDLKTVESTPLDIHANISSIREDFMRRLDRLEEHHHEQRSKHVAELRDELLKKYVQLTTYMSNWNIEEPHTCTKCYKSILGLNPNMEMNRHFSCCPSLYYCVSCFDAHWKIASNKTGCVVANCPECKKFHWKRIDSVLLNPHDMALINDQLNNPDSVLNNDSPYSIDSQSCEIFDGVFE